MRKLRLGFFIDSMGQKKNGLNNNDWWPYLVTNYWGAEITDIISLSDNGLENKISKLVTSSATESMKDTNPDIVFVQGGFYDLFVDSPNYVEWSQSIRSIIDYFYDKKTHVIFVDYHRGQTVLNDSKAHNAAEQYHNRLNNMSLGDMATMTHLWWEAMLYPYLSDGKACPWYDSNDKDHPNKYGNILIADRIIAASVPLVQRIHNERLITYGIIGDSWASADTALDCRKHWTRLVAKYIGAHLTCDASLSGWTTSDILNGTRYTVDGVTLGSPAQLNWISQKKPDFVFMICGSADVLKGDNLDTIANQEKQIIQQLINIGVKKILWSYYGQFNWDSTIGMHKTRFEDFRVLCRGIANQFSSYVTFCDAGMTNAYTDYSKHRENFYNSVSGSYDDMHLHDDGWQYLADGLISSFASTAADYKYSANKPKLNIRSKDTLTEWLGSNVATSPRINISSYKLTAPFYRHNGFEIKTTNS